MVMDSPGTEHSSLHYSYIESAEEQNSTLRHVTFHYDPEQDCSVPSSSSSLSRSIQPLELFPLTLDPIKAWYLQCQLICKTIEENSLKFDSLRSKFMNQSKSRGCYGDGSDSGSSYRSQGTFRRKTKSSTEEDEAGLAQFHCHLCSFRAMILKDLDLHMVTHVGQKLPTNPHCCYLDDLRHTTTNVVQTGKKSRSRIKDGIRRQKDVGRVIFEEAEDERARDCDPRMDVRVTTAYQDRPSVIVSQSTCSLQYERKPTVEDDGKEKEVKMARLYSCPFCKFSSDDEILFVTHFNSHSQLFDGTATADNGVDMNAK